MTEADWEIWEEWDKVQVGVPECDWATHIGVDHYFEGPWPDSPRIWFGAFAGGGWRRREVTEAEEQGLLQLAFAADRVMVCWKENNVITMLRAWKTFG